MMRRSAIDMEQAGSLMYTGGRVNNGFMQKIRCSPEILCSLIVSHIVAVGLGVLSGLVVCMRETSNSLSF